MSLYLAVSGLTISGYLAFSAKTWKQIHPMIIPFLFYTGMETLQFFQHSFLDQCGYPTNYWLTVCAHVLVVAQPLLWNFYRYIRARNEKEAAVFKLAMLMSFVWAVFFTLRLIPRGVSRGVFPKGITYKTLNKNEIMVGPEVCTKMGPTHLFWTLPYFSSNGTEPNFFTYLLLWFVPALYENHGYIKFFYWIGQVVFVNWIVGSIHELPTLWCALSVPVLLLVLYLDRSKKEKNE